MRVPTLLTAAAEAARLPLKYRRGAVAAVKAFERSGPWRETIEGSVRRMAPAG